MAPLVRACENPRGIPPHPYIFHLAHPISAPAPLSPQPISPSLLPSNPQAPPFLPIFLLPIAFLFRCLPTGKYVFNYTDVLFGVRRGFGVRARQGSSIPREFCGSGAEWGWVERGQEYNHISSSDCQNASPHHHGKETEKQKPDPTPQPPNPLD